MKKAWIVYVDDGNSLLKMHIPAKSKREAIKAVEGIGEVISCKEGDRTENNPISMNCITNALCKANFGQEEIDLIFRALADCEFIA